MDNLCTKTARNHALTIFSSSGAAPVSLRPLSPLLRMIGCLFEGHFGAHGGRLQALGTVFRRLLTGRHSLLAGLDPWDCSPKS